eukprot:Phypoly_transcript_05887.p2 GENE.Phypoly_transcript_05887~~Phypoly_transcript_05887.p2  ORF type:complete len:258 (+),score=31.51 Phypoly_transcript_05887:81-854(+)
MHTASFICITFVGFLTNVAWGIVMPNLWYFIEIKGGNHLQLGIAVSAFSLSQIFFLQIYGKWADKRPMKEGLYFSFVLGIGSYLLYAISSNPYIIIVARLLAGVEAGNLTITNSFVASSCGPDERTKYMARMNGINVVGFVIAPLINFGLLATNFKVGNFVIDQYVASGLLIVAMHFIIILLFLVLFKEPSKESTENEALLRSQKGKEKETKEWEDHQAAQKKKLPRKAKVQRVRSDEVALLMEDEEFGEDVGQEGI